MNVKYGVTGIIFDKIGQNYHFLLLHRKLNWSGWEFVKGGIEKGEIPTKAVLREIKEETGLENVDIVRKVVGPIEWLARDTKYIYNVFLVKADKKKTLTLATDIVEHDDFKWVEEKQVLQMLTHNDNKDVFNKAMDWLKENG